MTFTDRVRDELAHADCTTPCCRRAELAAVLRLGGRLELRGGAAGSEVGWLVDTPSGALARRMHVMVRALAGTPAAIEVHQPGGLRRATTYRLRFGAGSGGLLADLGLLDARGRPRRTVPADLARRACDAAAYARGALLAAASVSDPRRAAHLEIRAGSEAAARHLEGVLRRCGVTGGRATPHGDGWRIVVKGGEEVGALLARTGAHDAFLRHDAGRLRRELRVAANRAANADRANLGRSVAAAARDVAAIQALTAGPEWDDLDAGLRALALARLANPEASLGELGRLLDPPVGKTTVHRRLRRLLAVASGGAAAGRRAGAPGEGPPGTLGRVGRPAPESPQRDRGRPPDPRQAGTK